MAFVVAIDGPAASGKGAIATRLGVALGLPVLDTGLLYRAVGVALLAAEEDLTDEDAAARAARALKAHDLDDPVLRTDRAAEAASQVAVHPAVRAALIDFQRAFAGQDGGAILDGRDIGTVIIPAAPAKIFVTATPRVRAERRWRQLRETQPTLTYDDVLADILRRDARDSGRAAAPLRRASDAVLLDTTDLGIDVAFDVARCIVEAARG